MVSFSSWAWGSFIRRTENTKTSAFKNSSWNKYKATLIQILLVDHLDGYFFTIFQRIFHLLFNKRISILTPPLILFIESVVENTIQNNSLAAFLGSIKFKTKAGCIDSDYPSIPLASFNSSLEPQDDISSEEVEFILSDN